MYSRRALFKQKPSKLIRELIQWPYETGEPAGADTPVNLTWRVTVLEAKIAVMKATVTDMGDALKLLAAEFPFPDNSFRRKPRQT